MKNLRGIFFSKTDMNVTGEKIEMNVGQYLVRDSDTTEQNTEYTKSGCSAHISVGVLKLSTKFGDKTTAKRHKKKMPVNSYMSSEKFNNLFSIMACINVYCCSLYFFSLSVSFYFICLIPMTCVAVRSVQWISVIYYEIKI